VSLYDSFFAAYRVLRDATHTTVQRQALRIVGGTLTDNPATGETVLTIAGGSPLASIVGSAWINVDSADPANPIVSISPAPTTAATALRIMERDASGDAYATKFRPTDDVIFSGLGTLSISQQVASAGDGATGTIKAQNAQQSGNTNGGLLALSGGDGHGTGYGGGAALQVGGVNAFRVAAEANFGGAHVAYLGNGDGPTGLIFPDGTTTVEIAYFPRSTTGDGAPINFTAQDATDGNGGNLQFTTGAKGGGGTANGSMVFGVGGLEFLNLSDDGTRVGDSSNVTTASVDMRGPEAASATTGGAGALPALPMGYLVIKINGTSSKIPYYNT